MKHLLLAFALGILTMACVARADSGNAAVGTWNCVATDRDNGDTANWTMVITADSGGNLSGTVTGGPGQFTMVNPVLNGNTLTFQVASGNLSFSAQLTISGSSISGTYSGSANGTVAGDKQS